MQTISYTAFRQKLAHMLDKVNDDHVPVMITRQNGEDAVVMSAKDFRAYEETAYLMASPRNAERLNNAIAQIEKNQVIPRDMIE